MANKILSKKEKFGIIQQSKASNHWSAPAAANAAFKTVHWINAGVLNPNPDVQVDQFNVISQNGTHREYERVFYDASSGLPTLPFNGTCDKTTMAAFLVSALQACTEGASTPYSKAITSAGLTGTIDWANNEGYLFTLALNQGASADDGIIIENAIINTLNLVWDLNSRGVARLVNMNGTFVGNKINYEQTLNGTWTNATAAQTGFYNNTDTWGTSFNNVAYFTVDGVDYSAQCIRRFELQINNNITSNCKTTGGKANQYDWNPQYKAIITLDHNATTEKILKDFQDGEDVGFYWGNDATGDGTTDGKWNIDCSGDPGFLMAPPKTYNGDFLGIQLEVDLFSKAAATPLTMTFTDTIDWAF